MRYDCVPNTDASADVIPAIDADSISDGSMGMMRPCSWSTGTDRAHQSEDVFENLHLKASYCLLQSEHQASSALCHFGMTIATASGHLGDRKKRAESEPMRSVKPQWLLHCYEAAYCSVVTWPQTGRSI